MTEPRQRSYSQLTSFAECSYRYYLQRVQHVPATQAVWFPAGRAFHSATEWFDREIFAGRPAVGEMRRVWEETFEAEVDKVRLKEPDTTKWRAAGRPTADKPRGEDLDWWRANGYDLIARYVAWWEAGPPWAIWEMPDGNPALEVPLMVPFNGVPVLGYVDQVLENTETGRLLVVDKKTGAREPAIPLQLALYSAELEAVFARPFGWGAYYLARAGKLTEPKALSHWSPSLLGDMFGQMDQAERLGLYVPNVGQHCSGCLVRKWCPPAGGQEYQEAAA